MQETRSNRNIDSLIMAGNMAIDEVFAIEALSKYLQDLSFLERGATYAELGISERRKATMPTLFSLSENFEVSTDAFTSDNINARSGQFAHLRLSGVMQLEDGLSSRGVNSLVQDIRTANASPNVLGILLEVNSGGGEAISGGELMNAIKDSKKPVVAYAQRIGSAAYRGVLHSSRIIMAGNDAQAGSIGAFVSIPKGFAEWYNANYEDIYADASTDKNADFRGLLAGSTSAIKRVVNETAKIFQADVKRARTLNADMADETLSGGMFFARDAVKRGLADEVGTFETAVRALASEARKMGQSGGIKAEDMSLLDRILGIEAKEEPTVEAGAQETGEGTKELLEKVVAANEAHQAKTLQALEAITAAFKEFDTKVETSIKGVEDAFTAKLTAFEQRISTLETNQKAVEEKVVAKSAIVSTKGNDVSDTLTKEEKTFGLKVAKVGAQ